MAFLSSQEKRELKRLLEKSSTAGIRLERPKFIPKSEESQSGSLVLKIKSRDGDDYTADIIQGFSNEIPIIEDVLARIGTGDTSNNEAPVGEKYKVESIETVGEDTVYFFQPAVLF